MKTTGNLTGVLNINKPAGMTSHDVVDRVRRAAKVKRVGHTGTLDPMATGVLPICVGKATKIVQFLIAQDKEYSVEMKLGLVTDSQDTTGNILEENTVSEISRDRLEYILDQYTGEQLQIPPMISAKHHKGKRLYELARQGVEVKREPCKIHIHELTLLEEMKASCIRFRVSCSKGTYIRTLCHDLGQELGCGAAMSGLVRIRCGAFHIDGSVELDSLLDPETVQAHLTRMNEALDSLPSVNVGPEGKASMHCGRSLTGGVITRRNGEFRAGMFVRVTGRDGSLVGVGEALMNSEHLDSLAGNLRVIKPVKVFH